jgi:hypothetical protein
MRFEKREKKLEFPQIPKLFSSSKTWCKIKRTNIEELFKNKQNSEMKRKAKNIYRREEKKRERKSVWITMLSKDRYSASTAVGIRY